MKGTGYRESIRPRRLLMSFIIGGATWLALGPALGLAWADNDSEVPHPTTWSVPAPMHGDAGVYAALPGSNVESFAFRWVGPKQGLDHEGRLGPIHELWVHPVPAIETSDALDHDVYRFDADGVLLSAGHETRSETRSPCDPGSALCTRLGKDVERAYDHEETDRATVPCGLVHGLQGEPRGTLGIFAWSGGCGGHPSPLDARIENATRDSEDRLLVDILGITAERHRASMRFVLREDLAYPVEIDLDASTPAPTFVLHEFQSGSDEFALPPLQISPADPGPLEFLPRTRWGPSEEGLSHDFPLSRAIAAAIEAEPRVRLFASTHPQAYAAQMRFEHSQEKKTYADEWVVVLTDGSSTLKFRVRETTTPVLGPTIDVEILPSPGDRFPAPSLLPARMPTAKGLILTWMAYSGFNTFYILPAVGGVDDTEYPLYGGWGADIGCADSQCTEATIGYHACFNYDVNRVMPDTNPGYEGVHADDLQMRCELRFDETGRPLFYRESFVQVSDFHGNAPPARADPRPVPMAFAPAPRQGSGAEKFAIGAGIVSVFVALGYWIWPILRQGIGVALFSRIEKPSVLENRIRADIVALVASEPGIHFRELRRRLGRAHGTLIHHLQMLRAKGLLAAETVSGRTCYFLTEDRSAKRARAFASSPPRLELLRAAGSGDVSVSSLATRLGVRRQSVHENVRRLARDGLVVVERVGRSSRVHLTTLGRDALAFDSEDRGRR